MSKIGKLCEALKGEGRDGFATYHIARAIRNGLRCKSPAKRLQVARTAVAMTTVCAWLNGEGKIELRRGAEILIAI